MLHTGSVPDELKCKKNRLMPELDNLDEKDNSNESETTIEEEVDCFKIEES